MQAVDAGLKDRLLARLAHLRVDLLAGLFHHFLDAGRVDAAVGNELFQGDAGDFPPDGIKAGQDDRLGRVVDDQVDARRGLQGADVAPLAADDAALHLVVGQVDHGDRGLGHVVRRALLNRQGDDVAGLFIGLVLCLALDFADHDRRVVIGFALDVVHDDLAGFLRRHLGDALQFGLLLRAHGLDLLGALFELAAGLVEALFTDLQVVELFVEHLLALQEPALRALGFVPALAELLFGFGLLAEDFLLGLQDLFLLHRLGLGRGLVHELLHGVLGAADLALDFLFFLLAAEDIARVAAAGQRGKNSKIQNKVCNCFTT